MFIAMFGGGGTQFCFKLKIKTEFCSLASSVGYGTVKFPKVLCTLVNKFTSLEYTMQG